jgi:hypothetical protein
LIIALKNQSFGVVKFLADHGVLIRNECPLCFLAVRKIYEDALIAKQDSLVDAMRKYRLDGQNWPQFDTREEVGLHKLSMD